MSHPSIKLKLFGTTISLPLHCPVSATSSSGPVPPSSSSPGTSARDQESSRIELTSDQNDAASHQTTEDVKSASAEGDISVLKSSKTENQSERTTLQEEAPKKPDKVLPCPRCNSMETKFCYYNNYNVNQPRHFCKNCQRYWTAGGTMRNIPVGAGRRKNKSSCASHYQHIMIPESIITANANGLYKSVLGSGATVLTFGSDSPICDSMASVLNLAEKTQNGVLNGFHIPGQNITVSYGRDDNGDDHSVGASVTTSTSSEKKAHAGSQESVNKSYEGSPWHCPWNSLQWNSLMPPPSVPPGYPTATYWGCTLPAPWKIVSISSPQSSVSQPSPSFGSNSPTSRKHSRDGSILTQSNSQKEKPDVENKNSENGVLIPKTMRIDDPGEAAKSSICSILGIKNEKSSFLGVEGGLFQAFPSKGDDKSRRHHHHHVVETSSVLEANPAALLRSLAFHEQQA